MFEIFKKLFFILTPKEQKKSIFLLGMIIIMSVIDLIGAASIMPFMAIISNPEIIQTNNYLKSIFEFSNIFGVTNEKHFMFISGIFVFLLLVISLSFKAITTYAQLRFAQMREYNISKRLLENYIGQPYSWYLNRNSADLEKNILSEVNIVVGNGLLPMLTLITQGCVAISFTVFLLLVDTLLAISVATSLTLVYWLVYFFTSKFLNRIGKERLIANGFRFKSVNQIFGAFKAIKAKHLEDTFVERFSKPAQIFAKHQTSSQIISMLPRFALEAIGFGGVILIILYLMTTNENFNTIVPIIALYVFAGYRLLPAIQIIYASSSRLKFVSPALNELSEEINNIKIFNNNKSLDNIEFNNRIAIKKINYHYPNSSVKALDDISANIPAGSIIGIVGATGSGKTTFVDIILGLLQHQTGSLEVDNQIINHYNLKAWQNIIGYVPQNIYLSDDTVAANIAFGVPSENIDLKAIERAAKIANLHEFILNELPEKYQTKVGDRGIRLSGGQCQRIGIARALYFNPKLLIFDEATSALDNITELGVMEKINNLGGKITIILVAHRLSTVKNCDEIFYFERGKIKDFGDYEKLSKKYSLFKP